MLQSVRSRKKICILGYAKLKKYGRIRKNIMVYSIDSMKNRKRFLQYQKNIRRRLKHGMELSGECPWCGEANLFHYDKYDAKCCLNCDIWLDKACDDPKCPYCFGRPKTPSEAFFLEENNDSYKKERLRKNYQHKNDGRLRHMRKREENRKGENNI